MTTKYSIKILLKNNEIPKKKPAIKKLIFLLLILESLSIINKDKKKKNKPTISCVPNIKTE